MKKEFKFYSLVLATTVVCSFDCSAAEVAQMDVKELLKNAKFSKCVPMEDIETVLCENTVYREIEDEAIRLEVAKEAMRVLTLDGSKKLDKITLKILSDKIPDIEKQSLAQIKNVADVIQNIVKSDNEFSAFSNNPSAYLKSKGIDEEFEIAPGIVLDNESLAKHIKTNRREIVEGINETKKGGGLMERNIWFSDTCEYAIVNSDSSSTGNWGDNDVANQKTSTTSTSSKTKSTVSQACPGSPVIKKLIQQNLRLNKNIDKGSADYAYRQSAFVGVSRGLK